MSGGCLVDGAMDGRWMDFGEKKVSGCIRSKNIYRSIDEFCGNAPLKRMTPSCSAALSTEERV